MFWSLVLIVELTLILLSLNRFLVIENINILPQAVDALVSFRIRK